MIQALPEPTPFNTRLRHIVHDRDNTYCVVAAYDAGGPRFKAVEKRNHDSMVFRDYSRFAPATSQQDMVRAAVDALKRDIAAHLAIINPSPND